MGNSTVSRDLEKKILDRSAVIGVVGLGYVGLPLATGFASKGFHVVGVDLDDRKVRLLSAGKSTIRDVSDDEIKSLVGQGLLQISSSYDPLAGADAIFICVPTPFNAMKAPDLSFICESSQSVAKILRRGQLVILQSTTYPGTTEEIVMPILRATGLEVGADFFLAFSPERIDPGHTSSAGFTVENTPKVVGGVTPACVEAAALLLSQMIASVHRVSSPRAAEMTKLLENTFRSVNIALVNELAILAERMQIDIWEVIAAARSKPFGFMAFYPGPGVGGHCIPVDPLYLSWKAREFDYFTKFIELAAEVNTEMAQHSVDKISQALNRSGKSLRGSNILIVGVAFKANVDDARNSPAEPIIEMLLKQGATVSYHDPYVPSLRVGGTRYSAKWTHLVSTELTAKALSSADCVVIVTRHSQLDVNHIVEHSRLVVDTVNATGGISSRDGKVVRLGAPDPQIVTDEATETAPQLAASALV